VNTKAEREQIKVMYSNM
jgi:hypothetical protein